MGMVAALIVLLAPQTTGWRNDGSGRYPVAAPPMEWSETKNIVWSTEIGPNRYSSPVVADGRVFLVADPAWLFCVDAANGTVLWKKSNDFADLPDKVDAKRPAGDAGNTTPTPVTDGRHVYVVFGTGIVASYDVEGKRRWIRHFDLKPATEYGRAASPVLAGGKLLITLSHLIALDAETGKEVWRNKAVPECYGTPIVATVAGEEVAAMASGQIVRVRDGALLATDLGGLKFASPIVVDQTLYLIQTGSSAKRLAPESRDRWEARQLWEQEIEGGAFYASPLWDKGLIYAVANENIFTIVDAKDGKIVATRELESREPSGAPAAAPPNIYPSLVLAGKYLYLFTDSGEALVLEPGRAYKELKRNYLGKGHGGTPAFDGTRMYLRSGQKLYCIGEK